MSSGHEKVLLRKQSGLCFCQTELFPVACVPCFPSSWFFIYFYKPNIISLITPDITLDIRKCWATYACIINPFTLLVGGCPCLLGQILNNSQNDISRGDNLVELSFGKTSSLLPVISLPSSLIIMSLTVT